MRGSSNYVKSTALGSILTQMAPFTKANGTMTRERGKERSFIATETRFRACLMNRVKKALPNGIRGIWRVK